MAQSVGAKLWHMNNKEWTGSGFGVKAASEEIGIGIGAGGTGFFASNPNPSIIVNRAGLRFQNEDVYNNHTAQLLPTDQLVELNGLASGVGVFDPQYSYLTGNLPAAAAAESVTTDYCDYPNTPFYVVFDSTLFKAGAMGTGLYASEVTALHPTPYYTWSKDNSVELAKGWIISGADPTTLGNNIVCYDYFGRVVGMNAANLATTITNYNGYAASGKDLDFGRPASSMKALNNPPYYAMELCPISLNTNGGPVHDKYGRTIDVYNNPIPRLYSVGELGSIFGFLYHSGGNYPEALVMGQYAGKHAASLPRYKRPPT